MEQPRRSHRSDAGFWASTRGNGGESGDQMIPILCVVFFLSGASALVFESLWFRLVGLGLGNSVWAAAIVLASFMAGLAAGNAGAATWGRKVRRPVRCYAYLEIAIAVSGFAIVLALPLLNQALVPLFRSALGSPALLSFLRTAVAFALLVLPAAAMGATLPILVKALLSRSPNYGRVLGVLYGANTLGAVGGVIVNEVVLVEWLGIVGAGAVAAGLNLVAASLAILLARRVEGIGGVATEATGRRAAPEPWRVARLLTASFLSGMVLLALEVIWFRFMILFFPSFSLNFALMLATVLAGISVGGAAAAIWFRRSERAHGWLASALLINGALVILLYSNFGWTWEWFGGSDPVVHILWRSLFLMFPVCLASGLIFTMLGNALFQQLQSETRATGLLTLANTVGGAVGSLAAGFLLIPQLGIELSLLALAVTYGVAAIVAFDRSGLVRHGRRLAVAITAAVCFVAALLAFPFGLMATDFLALPAAPYADRYGEQQIATVEGVAETIQYLRKDLCGEPVYHRLITNNHSMSSTQVGDRRYMKLYVYLPVAVHPAPTRALLIGFGCGSTAKALVDTRELEQIDIVDLSEDVLGMSSVVYDDSENPLRDPRVEVYVEDGRFFLLTTDHRYDLITAEPPPPTLGGVVNLYSREYFQLMYERLTEGGMVTYWLPANLLNVEAAKSILRGFCGVFEDCSLWSGSGYDWMMVGSRRNAAGPVSASAFRRQWEDPMVGDEMRTLGFEAPEQLGSLFIAHGRRLRAWIDTADPVVDNYPHRILSGRLDRDRSLPVYDSFADPGRSLNDFMAWRSSGTVWPDLDLQQEMRYFAGRRTIDELIDRVPNVGRLRRCVRDPLLRNYVLWLFGSDADAQRIVAAHPDCQEPAVSAHLAAGAIQRRRFAEAVELLGVDTSWVPPGHGQLPAVFRRYLLSESRRTGSID